MKLVRWMMPLLALVAGCKAYTWTSPIPAGMRTVAVPTFRNESGVTELGSVVTQQVLREFQREGTMKIAPVGESAYEIQGVIVASGSASAGYNPQTIVRGREFRLTVMAKVSVIDKTTGSVVVGDRIYRADTTYLASGDLLTPERDASGRVADDLARQIVDDVVARNWGTDDAAETKAKQALEGNDDE